MSFMNWEKNYSVGIEYIDTQHQSMISMLNHLHDDIQTNADEKAKEAVKDLYIYTQYHIITEERLMRTTIHDFHEHLEDHDHILHTLKDCEMKIKKGKKVPADFLTKYKTWLSEHFEKYDKDLVHVVIDKE